MSSLEGRVVGGELLVDELSVHPMNVYRAECVTGPNDSELSKRSERGSPMRAHKKQFVGVLPLFLFIFINYVAQ